MLKIRKIFGHVFSAEKRFLSHVPVMADEIVQILNPQDGKVFIDMTFGGGGHTKRLLETNKSIKIVAVDRDPSAFKLAQELAANVALKSERSDIKQSVIPVHGKFSEVIKNIHLSGIQFGSVHGVIFDLGASSMQYDNQERGFALSVDGPLDMRMDTSNDGAITAEDVINCLSQEQLATIFKTLGEEKRSRKIASAVIDARTLLGRIKSTKELARVISSSSPASIDGMGRYAHPATKVFQALRIFVNNELNELNYALDKVSEFLIPAPSASEYHDQNCENFLDNTGIATVLTFHSLEDRIVKRHFTGVDLNEPIIKWLGQHDRIRTNYVNSVEEFEQTNEQKKWRPLTTHVIKPSETEKAANPRSRSAKLRAAARIS